VIVTFYWCRLFNAVNTLIRVAKGPATVCMEIFEDFRHVCYIGLDSVAEAVAIILPTDSNHYFAAWSQGICCLCDTRNTQKGISVLL